MKKIRGVVGVLMLVTLAGCGSSNQAVSTAKTGTAKTGSTNNAVQAKLISAVASTASANTAHVSTTVSSTGAQSLALDSDGTYDFSRKVGEQMTQLSGRVAQSQNLAFDTIVDGGTIYEKLPASLGGGLLGSKPWVKVDVAAVAESVGVNLGALSSGQGSDPSQGLSMLLATSSGVTTVGKEQVRGTDTTHYKANLDFNAAEANASAANKAELQKLAQVYNGQSVPVDVWIDSDNRVRRLMYTIDTSKLNVGAVSSVTTTAVQSVGVLNLTLEFYDFGTPVNVSVPTSDQVTDLSGLVGAGTTTSTTALPT